MNLQSGTIDYMIELQNNCRKEFVDKQEAWLPPLISRCRCPDFICTGGIKLFSSANRCFLDVLLLIIMFGLMQTHLAAGPVSSLERDDYTIAMRAFEDGMYDFSRQQLEHFLSTWPESSSRPLAFFFLAEISFQKKEYTRAVREFSTFIQRYGKHTRIEEAMFKLGRCKYLSGDYGGAVDVYQKITTEFPSSDMFGTAYYWIGEGQFRRKKFREAVEAFSAALTNRPTNHHVDLSLFRRGSCYLELGEFVPAEADFKEVYRTSTDETMRAEASILELRMMFERGDYRSFLQAIEDTNRVISKKADDEMVLLTATAWLRSGQPRACLAYLEKIFGKVDDTKHKPENLADLYFLRAASYLSCEQYEGAIDTYTRIISEFPTHAKAEEAMITAAYIHMKLGQVKEAEVLYNRSLKSFPHGKMRQETYKGLGSLEVQRQDYDAAIHHYTSAIALADTQTKPLILLAIGDAQRQATHYSEARQTYQSIVAEYQTIEDVTDHAAFQMVLCDYHLERYEQAVRQLNKFILGYPDSGLHQKAKYWLGETYLKMGNEDLAIVAFQEFLRGSSETMISRSVIEKLAYSLYRSRRYQEALVWFEQLRELLTSPPPEMLLAMAHSYEESGLEKDSRRVYAEFIMMFPHDHRVNQVRLSLAQRYVRDNDIESAADILQRIVPETIADGTQRWQYDMVQSDVMIRQGRGKGALAWLQSTQRRTVDIGLKAKTRLAIGRLLLNEGMVQEAYNEYIGIVTAGQPVDVACDAMQAMYQHAMKSGDSQSAKTILDTAKNTEEKELIVSALYLEASDDIVTGNTISAFDIFSRIIEQFEGHEPWYSRALMKAGLIREEQGDHVSALEYYRRLISAQSSETLRVKAIQRLEFLDTKADSTTVSAGENTKTLVEENLMNKSPVDVSKPQGKDNRKQ